MRLQIVELTLFSTLSGWSAVVRLLLLLALPSPQADVGASVSFSCLMLLMGRKSIAASIADEPHFYFTQSFFHALTQHFALFAFASLAADLTSSAQLVRVLVGFVNFLHSSFSSLFFFLVDLKWRFG